jgi:hypothetical protein
LGLVDAALAVGRFDPTRRELKQMTSFTGPPTEVRPHALVVYESMFGNTKAVAEVVALALSHDFEVDLTECGSAPCPVPDDIALLVVGAPTHAFSLSRANTRENARQQAPANAHPSQSGLRDWLGQLQHGGRLAWPAGLVAAAFDTKVAHPRLPGSAAAVAAKKLRRLGVSVVVAPKTFHVEGTLGPLVDGESDASLLWGRELAGACLTSRKATSG